MKAAFNIFTPSICGSPTFALKTVISPSATARSSTCPSSVSIVGVINDCLLTTTTNQSANRSPLVPPKSKRNINLIIDHHLLLLLLLPPTILYYQPTNTSNQPRHHLVVPLATPFTISFPKSINRSTKPLGFTRSSLNVDRSITALTQSAVKFEEQKVHKLSLCIPIY